MLGNDLIEKGLGIIAFFAFGYFSDHFASGHLQRTEQIQGSMPLVGALLNPDNPAIIGHDVASLALQGFDAGLLINAEDHCADRRIQIQPDNVGRLSCKVLVVLIDQER